MVYQDHFTKFIQLRPLKSKCAVEVAAALIDIFSIFGVPQILQSDNGREFRNQIVTALKTMWPDLNLVHGRARHPQSQGSVERANADIKKMLATWMREHKSTKWTTGLKFVQLKKNHTYHSASKCTPYMATFGIETPLGLQSTTIPVEEWSKLKTANELLNILGINSNEFIDDQDDEDDNEDDVFDPVDYDILPPPPPPPPPPHASVPPATMAPRGQLARENEQADSNADKLLGIRESVRKNQQDQADKMLKRSSKYIGEVEIGDYVILPIPNPDKGLTEPHNLICRVIDIDYVTDLYELCCEAGVLDDMFARNAFDRVEGNLELNMRLDKRIGKRAAVTALSVGGGQGMVKCECTSACATKRCGCRMKNILCNSKCHGGNSNCKNK